MSDAQPVPRSDPHARRGSTPSSTQHCAQGELRFQRCTDCGTWRHLPRVMCAQCGSDAWSWQRVERPGPVYSRGR